MGLFCTNLERVIRVTNDGFMKTITVAAKHQSGLPKRCRGDNTIAYCSSPPLKLITSAIR